MVIQTPWEANGSPDYGYCTSAADEATFLDQVIATGRVALTQIGSAPSGQPINLVRLGITPPPYAASPASGLWVSSQHTRETSPRESALTLIRDMAETTDPTMLAYLASHPMFLIPTPYPDTMGQEATPGVIDHNRDHLQLSHSGSRAIAAALETVRPQMVQDMHTGGINDIDIEPSQFAGVDPDLRALGQAASLAVRAHLLANDVSTGELPVNEDLPATLRNAAGLRHTVALLTEDYGGNVMSRRIAVNITALQGVCAWHAANSARIAATQRAAHLRAITQGDEGSRPYTLGSAHTSYMTGGRTTLNPPPVAYRIAGQDRYDTVSGNLAAFGVEVSPDGASTWGVSMGQPAASIIPLLIDPESTEALATAQRIGIRFPPADFDSYGVVRIAGYDCPVEHVGLKVDGVVRTVWPI